MQDPVTLFRIVVDDLNGDLVVLNVIRSIEHTRRAPDAGGEGSVTAGVTRLDEDVLLAESTVAVGRRGSAIGRDVGGKPVLDHLGSELVEQESGDDGSVRCKLAPGIDVEVEDASRLVGGGASVVEEVKVDADAFEEHVENG